MNKKIENFIKMLENDNSPKYRKVYYRPNKVKSVIGFICSLLFMLILIFLIGFQLNSIFIIMFIIDFLLLVYYSINLFTAKGLLIPKYIEDNIEENKYQIDKTD